MFLLLLLQRQSIYKTTPDLSIVRGLGVLVLQRYDVCYYPPNVLFTIYVMIQLKTLCLSINVLTQPYPTYN